MQRRGCARIHCLTEVTFRPGVTLAYVAAAHLFCQSAFHTVSRFFASTRLGGRSRFNHFKKFAPEGQIF